MGHSIGADLPGHLHQPARNQGACQSRGQGIATFIKRIGTDGWKRKLLDERLDEIAHQRLTGAGLKSLATNRLKFIALSKVSGEGDHVFDTPLLLEIRNADTRIHATGISEHNLLGASHQADS